MEKTQLKTSGAIKVARTQCVYRYGKQRITLRVRGVPSLFLYSLKFSPFFLRKPLVRGYNPLGGEHMKIDNWEKEIQKHDAVVARFDQHYDRNRKTFVKAMKALYPLERRITAQRKTIRNKYQYGLTKDEYRELLPHVLKINWQTDRLHFILRITEISNKRLKQVLRDANNQHHQQKRDAQKSPLRSPKVEILAEYSTRAKHKKSQKPKGADKNE